jgi:sec-independent protein translocase protein TatB
MFDSIGFPELILVAVVTLLILGPERLPEALRTAGLWLGRAQRSFSAMKAEIEKEIGMDEIKRQLHNEAVMEEMRKIEQDVKTFGQEVKTETSSIDDQGDTQNKPSLPVDEGVRAGFLAEDETALSEETALSQETALSEETALSQETAPGQADEKVDSKNQA